MELTEKECCFGDTLDLTHDFYTGIDDTWVNLRKILTAKGFDLSCTVLIAFMESENDVEYGLFVTKDGEYEFHRSYDCEYLDSWLEGYDDFDAFSGKLYINYIKWSREFLRNDVFKDLVKKTGTLDKKDLVEMTGLMNK